MFIPGGRELASISSPGDLLFFNPDTSTLRTVRARELGGTAAGLNPEASTSRYVTVGNVFIVDTGSLKATTIASESRTWIAADSSRASSLTHESLLPVLNIYSPPKFSRRRLPLRKYEEVFPDNKLSHFIGQVEGGLL